MDKRGEEKRDSTSVKLFFAVLGIIAAYQLSDWMRDEPAWRSHTSEDGTFVVEVAGSVDQRSLEETVSAQEVEFQYLMFARGDVQYALAHGDISAVGTTDSLLQKAVVDMAEKVQGKIVSQRADTLAHCPHGAHGFAPQMRANCTCSTCGTTGAYIGSWPAARPTLSRAAQT